MRLHLQAKRKRTLTSKRECTHALCCFLIVWEFAFFHCRRVDAKKVAGEFVVIYNVLQQRITSPSFDVSSTATDFTSTTSNLHGRKKKPCGMHVRCNKKRGVDHVVPEVSQPSVSQSQIDENRKLKSATIRKLAGPFCEHLRNAATSAAGTTYYMHSLEMHLADQIDTCPIDIYDLSGSGIEQVNLMTKRMLRYVFSSFAKVVNMLVISIH